MRLVKVGCVDDKGTCVSRCLDAFLEMQEAVSYRCRVHERKHYVDRVMLKDGVATYLLHDNPIAWFDVKQLTIWHCGYHTLLTMYRLSAILSRFEKKYKVDVPIVTGKFPRAFGGKLTELYLVYKGWCYEFSKPVTITVDGRIMGLERLVLPYASSSSVTRYYLRGFKKIGPRMWIRDSMFLIKTGDKFYLVRLDGKVKVFERDHVMYREVRETTIEEVFHEMDPPTTVGARTPEEFLAELTLIAANVL